jgi:hypothetical protein
MEAKSREDGIVIKRETISRHLKTCLSVPKEVTPQKMAHAAAHLDVGEDVATLVQAQVIEKLKDGSARVTVQHGLQAQQLLDRRAERAKDRELAITLARLLHSPLPPTDLIMERTVIEGTAVEVS